MATRRPKSLDSWIVGEGRRRVRVWIDATKQDDGLEIFGMTLLERLLRSLLQAQRQLDGRDRDHGRGRRAGSGDLAPAR